MTGGHLYNLNNRENVGVELLLDLLPSIYTNWYESFEINLRSHWALVRPIFKTRGFRQPEDEIDIVFGRMNVIVDDVGVRTLVWPPPTDYLVAVEAKCPRINREDLEPLANATEPKSNLSQQLQRDIDLEFHRVAALHIIATNSGSRRPVASRPRGSINCRRRLEARGVERVSYLTKIAGDHC